MPIRQLSDHYRYNSRWCYYTGTASGRIYKVKRRKHIVSMIEKVNTLSWEEVGKLNSYFMGI